MPLNFGKGVAAGLKSRAAVVSTSGNNAFITAVAGKRIAFHYYAIQTKDGAAVAAYTVKFFDTAGTPAQIANSPEWDFDPDNREGVVTGIPTHDSVLFVGSVGQGVNINLSAARGTMVHVVYSEVS